MALGETAKANPCQTHEPTLACPVCIWVCVSFLYTQAHRGFSAKATCCAVPLVCGFLVYNRTRAHTYTNTHKDAKSEKERVVPPGPHLMETRSPGVLEHSSAPLSLRSTRGSIIMTHYTNSHHTHTLGFLFFTVSHLRQVDRALLLLSSLPCTIPLFPSIFNQSYSKALTHSDPQPASGSFPTSICSLPVSHNKPTTVSQGSVLKKPKLLLFLRNDPNEGKAERTRVNSFPYFLLFCTSTNKFAEMNSIFPARQSFIRVFLCSTVTHNKN